jgi:hypothetical protein
MTGIPIDLQSLAMDKVGFPYGVMVMATNRLSLAAIDDILLRLSEISWRSRASQEHPSEFILLEK